MANEERYSPNEIQNEIVPPHPETVIDLHTHLVGARYLTLQGFPEEKGAADRLVEPAKRLLGLLAGKADLIPGSHRAAIEGLGETDSLESPADLLTVVASQEMARRVVSKGLITFEGSRAAGAAAGLAVLRSDELYAVLEEIEELAWPEVCADIARNHIDDVEDLINHLEHIRVSTDFDMLDQVGDWVFRRFRRSLLWLLEKLRSTTLGRLFATPLDCFKFFLLMLSKEATLLEALYAHCSRERIPILTYCSPVGLEAFKGSKVLCDPDYWLGALNDYRDFTLCYGHAGGGGEKIVDPETGSEVAYFGWCSKNDEEWADDHNFARKVVEHCCRFPNVFCDFSYFGAIVNDREKATHLKRNLIAALGGPNGDLHFGKKVMYGSGWHMPKIAGHAAEFLAFWRELFDDPRIASYRDAFFFKNALRFLGLESMVQRHERGSTPVLSASTTRFLRSLEGRSDP